ncbi:hypothetical protein HKX48_008551 [Thoreauomyces humboldtii]|nr:hypothetical protein HKX48_008551 [Thoreauomyces humboldtii]
MSENRGFASMDKDEVREIASKGGRASNSSTSDGLTGEDDSGAFQPSSTVDANDSYSEPAHNTRSQVDMTDDERKVSESATDGDEIVTYGGNQGFASMKETDPERQREIASMGGNAEVVDSKEGDRK